MTSSSEDVYLECLTTSTYLSSMTIGFLRVSRATGVAAMYCIHNLDISEAGPASPMPRHEHMPASA